MFDEFYRVGLYGTAPELQQCVRDLTTKVQGSPRAQGEFLFTLYELGDVLTAEFITDYGRLTQEQAGGLEQSRPLCLDTLYKGAFCLQSAYFMVADNASIRPDIVKSFGTAAALVDVVEESIPEMRPPMKIQTHIIRR